MSEESYRKCDQSGCVFPATHAYVWDKPFVACLIHAKKALSIADAMGFPTVANTMRQLTIDEMISDEGFDNAPK